MDNIHLPFRIRWAGDPMPDISEFAEPLAIPFRYVDANGSSGEDRNQQPPQVDELANRISANLNETTSAYTSNDNARSSAAYFLNTTQVAQLTAPDINLPLPFSFPNKSDDDAARKAAIYITKGFKAFKEAVGNIFKSQADEQKNRPPPGSKPINETPWSGSHREIKKGITGESTDNIRISPDNEVWSENPDGSWTNHGSASIFTGSGNPLGRRGKDRGKR